MIYSPEDEMPFGKYKGVKLKDIPKQYLIYIYENNKVRSKEMREIKHYIFTNIIQSK